MQTNRDTGSSGGVTHSQDGDVLGPVQPPNRCLGLADPLHHGHIMLTMKNIVIYLKYFIWHVKSYNYFIHFKSQVIISAWQTFIEVKSSLQKIVHKNDKL